MVSKSARKMIKEANGVGSESGPVDHGVAEAGAGVAVSPCAGVTNDLSEEMRQFLREPKLLEERLRAKDDAMLAKCVGRGLMDGMYRSAPQDGDCVIIRYDDGVSLSITRVGQKHRFAYRNRHFSTEPLVGATYGTVFNMTPKGFEVRTAPVRQPTDTHSQLLGQDEATVRDRSSVDNRFVEDAGGRQGLSKAMILKAKGEPNDDDADETPGSDEKDTAGSGGATPQVHSASVSLAEEAESQDEHGEDDGGRANGKALIGMLVNHHAGWEQKTVRSQEKYLRRKAAKYLPHVTLERVSPILLLRSLFAKPASKKRPSQWKFSRTLGLREDAFASLMVRAGVASGKKIIVVDDTDGMVVSGMLHRVLRPGMSYGDIRRSGTFIMEVYDRSPGTCFYMQHMNLDLQTMCASSVLERISLLELLRYRRGGLVHRTRRRRYVRVLNGTDDKWCANGLCVEGESDDLWSPQQKSDGVHYRIRELVEQAKRGEGEKAAPKASDSEAHEAASGGAGFDALVVVTKNDPTVLVSTLLPLLRPSSPFVVFNAELEAISGLYRACCDSRHVLGVAMHDFFARAMQVLPGSSHPMVNMHPSSGFVLSGFRVAPMRARQAKEQSEE